MEVSGGSGLPLEGFQMVICMFMSILPHSAFTTPNSRSSVDHILGLLFEFVLSQSSLPPGSPSPLPPGSPPPLTPCSPLLGVPAMPRLKLPTDINVSVWKPRPLYGNHVHSVWKLHPPLINLVCLFMQIKLDAVLSGLESCDHSNRPEMLHVRRPFLLTGSCLVHRGALACSHLSSEEQRGVALFCHAYHLLELTASESVSQIVIWKEVRYNLVAVLTL